MNNTLNLHVQGRFEINKLLRKTCGRDLMVYILNIDEKNRDFVIYVFKEALCVLN